MLNDVVSDASLLVAHPDDVVGRVADLMIVADVGRAPIAEPETGALIGLISRKDLLRPRSASGSLERDRRAILDAPRANKPRMARRARTKISKPYA